MRYSLNQELIFKKKHACKSDKWKIIKLGAIIKLECDGCKRQISLLPSEIDKRVKRK